MPDLSSQLRDYFDAVIERTTADDVLARSAFDRESESEPTRLSIRRRSAWQAALAVGFGFGLTMLVAGAMLAVALLAGELASGDGPGEVGSGVAAPAGGVGSGWIVAAGLLITGTVAAAAMVVPRRISERPRSEERDMTTIETQERTEELDGRVRTLKRRNRWLVVAVAVLLVAAAALGGALLFGSDDGEAAITPGVASASVDAATVDEINALVDANLRGWSEGDGDAVMATMATDGFHISGGTDGSPYSGDRLRGFSSSFENLEWERVSPPIIERDGNGYYVAELEIVSNGTDPADGGSMLIVMHIVSEDGELRIAEQVVYEDIVWSRYESSS